MKYFFIIILLIGSNAKARDQQTFSKDDMCELAGYYSVFDDHMFGLTWQILDDAGTDIGSGRCNRLRMAAVKASKTFELSGKPSDIGNDLLSLQTRFNQLIYRSIIKQSGIKIE